MKKQLEHHSSKSKKPSALNVETLNEPKSPLKNFKSFLSLLKQERESEAYSLYKQMNEKEKQEWIEEASEFLFSRYKNKDQENKINDNDRKIISFIVKIVMENNHKILKNNPNGIKEENEMLLNSSKIGNVAYFLEALYNGADLNARGRNGEIFLHELASKGKLNILKFAYENLKEETNWNARNSNGLTFLHEALFKTNYKIVDFAIREIKPFPLFVPFLSSLSKEPSLGFSLREYEEKWQKALSEAVYKDISSIEETIESYNLPYKINRAEILSFYNFYKTVLELSNKGEVQAYSLYKQMNKDEKRLWLTGASQFLFSRYKNKDQENKINDNDRKIISFIVKIVMENNHKILKNNPNGIKEENEMLLNSSKIGNVAYFLEALYNGADLNARGRNGETFVHNALWNGLNVLQFAYENLKEETNWNAKNKKGGTFIHDICRFGLLERLKFAYEMLNDVIDWNALDNKGWSALHHAVSPAFRVPSLDERELGIVDLFINKVKLFPLFGPLPSSLAEEQRIILMLKEYEAKWKEVISQKGMKSIKEKAEEYGFENLSELVVISYLASICDGATLDLLKEIRL